MRPIFAVSSCALAFACALAVSACGGDSRPYDQIPTSTPALLPPADANDVASGTGATTTTPTTTTDTTGSSDTGSTDTGGTSGDTGGGTGGGTGGDTGGGGTPADTGGITPE